MCCNLSLSSSPTTPSLPDNAFQYSHNHKYYDSLALCIRTPSFPFPSASTLLSPNLHKICLHVREHAGTRAS